MMNPKIIWIMILLVSFQSFAISPQCSDYEKKSEALITAQDADIDRLKGEVKDCEEKCMKQNSSVPFYVWLLIGIIGGGSGVLYLTRGH